MKDGTKIFGVLLVGFGIYKLARPTPGFLGLTNPIWPYLAIIALGVYLFVT